MKKVLNKKRLVLEEVVELIDKAQYEDLIVVGGQAVFLYARLFNIDDLIVGLSGDLDMIGAVDAAQKFRSKLSLKSSFKKATIDDNTINTAILAVNLDGEAEPIVIDFISSVGGLSDEEVRKRALELDVEGKTIKLIHPFHLLQSKLYNIIHIPAKKSQQGLEQLDLSFKIAECYLREIVSDPERHNKAKLKAIENYFSIITSKDALEANALYGPIDLIRAIRENSPRVQEFSEKRLPQMVALMQKKIQDLSSFRQWQDDNTLTKSEQSKIGRLGKF